MENRRTVLKGLLGTMGLTAAAGPGAMEAFARGVASPESAAQAGAAGAEAPNAKPNIMFFLGEGLQHNESSIAGNPLMNTPNIDRIGREGCRFNNAFVVNALCLPSRATILTGLYSHTTGAASNIEGTIPPRFKLICDLIHDAGYETAFFGKAHVKGSLTDHYWDYYFGFEGQADYYRPVITEGIKGKYGKPTLHLGYVDDILTQKAVEWMQQEHAKPICVFFWFYAPHVAFYRPPDQVNTFNGVPVPVPAGFDEFPDYKGKPRAVFTANNKVGVSEVFDNCPRSLEELVKNHYVGAMNNDSNMGKMLAVLENQDKLDNTAVVFSSDHGFFLGEHRFYDKRFMYEPSIRVPMMIRYPKRVPAGTRNREMVLNLDLAPTLLDIAGVPVPAEMQGHSMMPLAEGKNVPWREDWLYEYYEYPGWQNVLPCRGLRTKRYKYIHFFLPPQEFELYDLENDPNELHNLYGLPAYNDLVKQLAARLEQHRRDTGDTYQFKPTGLPLYDSTTTL